MKIIAKIKKRYENAVFFIQETIIFSQKVYDRIALSKEQRQEKERLFLEKIESERIEKNILILNEGIKELKNNKGIFCFKFIAKDKNIYTLNIEKDSFTKEYSLESSIIFLHTYNSSFIQIHFVYENKKHYLALSTYKKEIELKKGEKISFLFDDDTIFPLNIKEKGVRVDKDYEGVVLQTKIEIELNQIEKFNLHILKAIRYNFINSPIEIDLGNDRDIFSNQKDNVNLTEYDKDKFTNISYFYIQVFQAIKEL